MDSDQPRRDGRRLDETACFAGSVSLVDNGGFHGSFRGREVEGELEIARIEAYFTD